jgi:hypothetical protein
VAESIEDKMAQGESKILYEKYVIWVRSLSSRQADGSRAPSWSSRLTRVMVSTSSSRLARARSQPAKTLIPRPLSSPSSGLRSAWRAVGRTGPSPAPDKESFYG